MKNNPTTVQETLAMVDLAIYNDGELELNIAIKEDTIWLTQKQIDELFENRTIQKYLIVQQEDKAGSLFR